VKSSNADLRLLEQKQKDRYSPPEIVQVNPNSPKPRPPMPLLRMCYRN